MYIMFSLFKKCQFQLLFLVFRYTDKLDFYTIYVLRLVSKMQYAINITYYYYYYC